jgi:hypothetical protein
MKTTSPISRGKEGAQIERRCSEEATEGRATEEPAVIAITISEITKGNYYNYLIYKNYWPAASDVLDNDRRDRVARKKKMTDVVVDTVVGVETAIVRAGRQAVQAVNRTVKKKAVKKKAAKKKAVAKKKSVKKVIKKAVKKVERKITKKAVKKKAVKKKRL